MDKGYHAAMRVPAKLAKICRTPADCPLEPAYAFAAGVDEGRAAATRPACILIPPSQLWLDQVASVARTRKLLANALAAVARRNFA